MKKISLCPVILLSLALLAGCSFPINFLLSSNADAGSLELSHGTLEPSFSPEVEAYSAIIPNEITSITVSTTSAHKKASVSAPVTLDNLLPDVAQTATITVTAENGATKTYTVAVTRAAATVTPSGNADLAGITVSCGTLSPVFAPGTTAYSASVANGITSVTVSGTKSHEKASVSAPVTLDNLLPDVAQTATITVTAENGATKIYTVAVTRAAAAGGGYKVAFVSLGGSFTAVQTVPSGGFASLPTPPTRNGYTFSGWYNTLKYDTAFNFQTSTISANTVLYAKWSRVNPETFAQADQPTVVIYDQGQTFYYGLRKPWNYDKPQNAGRTYPLYIALHSGGAPMSQPLPPNDYPCFVLSPKLPDNTGIMWTQPALDWFMPIIAKVLSENRIDQSKMFISGFSQGGVGTYQVANALYAYNGLVFASINRGAGASGEYYRLPDEALEKTGVHLQIGLKDYSGTVTCLRNAYALIKNNPANAGAVEVTYNHVVGSNPAYQATSWLIVKDGKERARLTEFPDLGHDMLYDASRFHWFYNQGVTQ